MAWFFSSKIYWSSLNHDPIASIWEKAISILAGNLNSSCSYLITAVTDFVLLCISRNPCGGDIGLYSLAFAVGRAEGPLFAIVPCSCLNSAMDWFHDISSIHEPQHGVYSCWLDGSRFNRMYSNKFIGSTNQPANTNTRKNVSLSPFGTNLNFFQDFLDYH